MYDQTESYWFNHNLLTHFDREYQTNSYLRMSISISTNDFLRFGQAYLVLTISNSIEKSSRSYTINLQNCVDIIKAFKMIIDNSNKAFNEKYQIVRKYNKDKSLIFDFFEKSDTKEKLVKIQIFHNESNFGSVIIDYSLFQIFAIQIRSFTQDYIRISGDIRRDFIASRNLQVNDKLSKEIRNLPNQLIPLEETNSSNKESNSTESKDLIGNELDEFIGGSDMTNVSLKIDENIPTSTPKIQEVNSDIVVNIFKKDLKNLESFLNSIATISSNPLENILNELKIDDVELLPGISETDFKSVSYLSKIFHTTHYQNYLENNVSIPQTTSIIKYNTDAVTVKPENITLAYDLLTIMGYLKCFRNKVESKESDVFINKSLMYLSFRCFADVLIFSFLTKKLIKSDLLLSNINSRFKYFDSIGFFDQYKKELESNNCEDITESEINIFVQQVIEGPIESSPCIDEFHSKSSSQFRLTPDNEFSIEQIINDIIPIEVKEKLGKPIDDILIDKSDKIKYLFLKKSNSTKSNRKSNLIKYISSHTDEDSEIYKIIKTKYSDSKNFNLSELEKIEEIDENIIKALYLWEPESDAKVRTNYKYFTDKIEEEMMTKDLIITKIKTNTESTEQQWDLNDLV